MYRVIPLSLGHQNLKSNSPDFKSTSAHRNCVSQLKRPSRPSAIQVGNGYPVTFSASF